MLVDSGRDRPRAQFPGRLQRLRQLDPEALLGRLLGFPVRVLAGTFFRPASALKPLTTRSLIASRGCRSRFVQTGSQPTECCRHRVLLVCGDFSWITAQPAAATPPRFWSSVSGK